MQTQTLTLRYRQPGAGEVTFQDPPYIISASVRIRTDIRRLFQAVVVPEYLDAWLRVPEHEVSSAVTPLQQSVGFALKWRSARATQSQILATYRTCRRRKLIISWKIEKNSLLKESSVILRLSGDFGCSVLSLFHSGLGTFDDFAWHRQFWHLSLERLVNLF
jgi:uncharacterized protein YndB with AHSA1/START domain